MYGNVVIENAGCFVLVCILLNRIIAARVIKFGGELGVKVRKSYRVPFQQQKLGQRRVG